MKAAFVRPAVPVTALVLLAWVVVLVGVVDVVRWLFGAELWLTLPVVTIALGIVVVSELNFWRRHGRG